MEQSLYKLGSKVKLVLNQVEGANLVCVQVIIASGYAEEKAKMEGVTYLLSRMILSGTKKYKTRENVLLKIKAMGGKIDACIEEEYSKISLSVPKDKLYSAIMFLNELVFNMEFSEEEFANEKQMALIELEKCLQNPNFVGKQYIKFLAFKRTGLSNSPLGKEKTIESLTMQDVRDYMHRILHPKNLIISVSGAFDEEYCVKLCNDTFGDDNKYSPLAKVEKYVPAVFGKEEFEKYKIRNLYQTRFFLGFRAPSHEDYNKYYIDIFLRILKFFVKKYFSDKTYFFGIETENLTFCNNGLAIINFMANHESSELTIKEFNECLKKTKIAKFTELFEIEKKNLIGEMLRSFNSMEDIATQCGVQMLYSKQAFFNEDVLNFISEMKFSDYQNVINQCIDCNSMYFAYVGKKIDNPKSFFDF